MKLENNIPIPLPSFCDYLFDIKLQDWKIGDSYLLTADEYLKKRSLFGLKKLNYHDDKYTLLNNIRSTINNAARRYDLKIKIYQNPKRDALRIWRVK
tara:strand:- start:2518 stop:2808 length:291 start_codon:yes stop_codon:yes gene_type:complete